MALQKRRQPWNDRRKGGMRFAFTGVEGPANLDMPLSIPPVAHRVRPIEVHKAESLLYESGGTNARALGEPTRRAVG